ncbi:MAG TPA: terminase family protein [Gemmatimonadaceae bacterium]
MNDALLDRFTAAGQTLGASSEPPDVGSVWTPQPGFQARAWSLTAFEALIGGAAGPGKTDLLLYRGLRQVHKPNFRKLFLRRTYIELREAMDRALLTFPRLGGEWHASEKRWSFPSGATYEFGYVERFADVLQYQGQEYSEIDVDEAQQIPEFLRVWTFLMSRVRRGGDGIVMSMWCSANPGGPAHLQLKKRFVDICPPDGTPVTDPETGLTRAFLAGKVTDNPILLERDPQYVRKLMALPEVTRRQLLDGDWTAGEGMALSELNREVHLIPAFEPPERWYHWGALDWGFNHPFVAGWFACDEDGTVYLVESVRGRRLLDSEMADRIRSTLPVDRFRKFVAGHDCWNEIRARIEGTPTTADTFRKHGILLQKANIDRKSGVKNLREYLHHQVADGLRPRFYLMDTPMNRQVFECLEAMVMDPDDPEDALKVDANEYGEGGDDAYDMCLAGDTLVRTARGWERIADMVGTSGICLTPMGWQRYNKVRQTRALAIMFRVTVDDGTTIEATPDHEILTPEGWRHLDELGPGAAWIRLAVSDRRWSVGAGLSGPLILAHGDGLLPSASAVPAPRRVRSELRRDSAEASNSPSGRRSGEQSARELGIDYTARPRSAPLDARAAGEGRAAHGAHAGDGESVAWLARGARLAFAERPARHGRATEGGQGVRVLRETVPHDPDARAVLSPELQDEVLPPRGPYSLARIVRIESGLTGPTFNMEVERAHCFAVNGGLVVHNCRYGLAARPLVGKPEPEPEFRAFSPEALAADRERTYKPLKRRKEQAAQHRRQLREWGF